LTDAPLAEEDGFKPVVHTTVSCLITVEALSQRPQELRNGPVHALKSMLQVAWLFGPDLGQGLKQPHSTPQDVDHQPGCTGTLSTRNPGRAHAQTHHSRSDKIRIMLSLHPTKGPVHLAQESASSVGTKMCPIDPLLLASPLVYAQSPS
jgi:hypothetical protein